LKSIAQALHTNLQYGETIHDGIGDLPKQ
jgi:hypothetical protein